MKARKLRISLAAIALMGAFGFASAQETQAQSTAKSTSHPDSASTGGTFPDASGVTSSRRSAEEDRRNRRGRDDDGRRGRGRASDDQPNSNAPMTDDQRMRRGMGLDGSGLPMGSAGERK